MEPVAILRLLVQAQGVTETQLQLSRLHEQAKRTADSTDKLEQSFTRANNKTADFNKSMEALKNGLMALKWPVVIAGVGALAPAIGALGVASVGAAGSMLAMAQGGAVVKLAMGDVAKALQGNKKAYDSLTPAQKAFVDQVKALKPQLQGLRNVAAQGLFPGVTVALKTIEPLMNRLKPVIAATGQELGKLAEAAARMLVSMGPALTRIGNNNVSVLQNLGKAAIELVKGFLGIMDAARPFTLWLSQTFAHLATQFASWTTSMQGQNALKQFFAQAQPVVHQVFELIGSIGKALFQIFRPQPGTARMIAQLQPLVKILGGIFSTVARTLGPSVIQLLINLVKILSSLAGTSGPLTLLIKALVAITTPIAKMVSHNPALGTMASTLAGVGITWKVISLLVSPLEKAAMNVGRLAGLADKVAKFGGSWGGVGAKVSSGLSGASRALGGFPSEVSSSMDKAEGAAKSGAPKIMDVFKSIFTKVNLFRGFGIALGVALVGGLVTMIAKGLAADDPAARGRVWAERFLKGVHAVGGPDGAPLVNPLPIPAQTWFTEQAGRFVGKYISGMDNRTFQERFARGATYLIDNPQIRQQTDRAATGLAGVIAKSFATRWDEVHFQTEPAFIKDVMLYLNRVPAWARGAASRSLAQYAAGLEQSKKLPVGATTATIVAMESKWPGLVNYLGNVSGEGARRVAANFTMGAARKSMENTLTNIRGQWGLWTDWNKNTNLPGLSKNFTSTFDYLKWVITHRTGEAKKTAQAQMEDLRTEWGSLLSQMEKATDLNMARIGFLISTHSKDAASAAHTNFFNIAASVAGAMNAGVKVTQHGTQIIGDALNQMLKAFGQKPIPLAGLSTKSILDWAQWWQQGSSAGSSGIGHRARGGLVDRPTIVMGEEAPKHPEVVIATNPAYRQANIEYWQQAGRMLGIPGFKTGGYVYPFRNAQFERVDQGVDFNAPAGSPIAAIGPGVVTQSIPGGSGWTSPENTQAAVTYRFTSGPRAGRYVYLVEDFIPRVRAGQNVKAGQIIGSFKSSPTGIETGWSTGPQASGYDAVAVNQPAGFDFEHFLQGLAHGKLFGGLFSLFASLPSAPKVLGGGTIGRIAQGALNLMTKGANAFAQREEAKFAPSSLGGGGIGGIPPSSGSVERDIYRTLSARGWDKIAIAAAIGNAAQESGLNPGSIGSGGGGLWGFTAGAISLSALQSAAQARGVPWDSAAFQAAFMAAHYPSYGSLAALNSYRDPAQAALYFMNTFERPNAALANVPHREQAARQAYSQGYREGGWLPPYGGSYAQGGIVPGPEGAPRTIIAHGGETVSKNTGPLVNIQEMVVTDSFDEQALAHRLAFLLEL